VIRRFGLLLLAEAATAAVVAAAFSFEDEVAPGTE